MGQLLPLTGQLKEDLDIDMLEAVADKGYEDKEYMLDCLMNGTIPHVIPKSGEDSHEFVHEKPAFLITNDFESPAEIIVADYSCRWHVETGISEAVKFFNINALSSPILLKAQ